MILLVIDVERVAVSSVVYDKAVELRRSTSALDGETRAWKKKFIVSHGATSYLKAPYCSRLAPR